MPNQHKNNSRYYKRSPSSDSNHSHHKDRRPYDKEKADRFDKYNRRSRSRTPPRDDNHRNKYHFQYQPKEQKRYQANRNYDKNKHFQPNYTRRDTHQKRDREKIDQYSTKFKYNRNQQKQSKYRDREPPYQKRERQQERDHKDYKRRKSSPSRSRSSSRKKTEMKMVYNRRSPREKEQLKRNKRQKGSSQQAYPKRIQQEKLRFSPPKTIRSQPYTHKQNQNHFAKQKFQRNSPNIQRKHEIQREQKYEQNKPFFRLMSIPPPPLPVKTKRQQKEIEIQKHEKIEKIEKSQKIIERIEAKPIIVEQVKPLAKKQQQIKQQKPQLIPNKVKVSKFDSLMQQARHNLSIGPPKSTFLLLDTFRTMNKFQVQTLDPKWMTYLKKDMENYPKERQQLVTKLNEPSDYYKLVGQQYVWMKEQRNEQELDLRFRFQQFKQHNANLSQLLRKIRFLD